jgi:hypothetical protein
MKNERGFLQSIKVSADLRLAWISSPQSDLATQANQQAGALRNQLRPLRHSRRESQDWRKKWSCASPRGSRTFREYHPVPQQPRLTISIPTPCTLAHKSRYVTIAIVVLLVLSPVLFTLRDTHLLVPPSCEQTWHRPQTKQPPQHSNRRAIRRLQNMTGPLRLSFTQRPLTSTIATLPSSAIELRQISSWRHMATLLRMPHRPSNSIRTM